jgi:hypothetical protein
VNELVELAFGEFVSGDCEFCYRVNCKRGATNQGRHGGDIPVNLSRDRGGYCVAEVGGDQVRQVVQPVKVEVRRFIGDVGMKHRTSWVVVLLFERFEQLVQQMERPKPGDWHSSVPKPIKVALQKGGS